MYQADIKYEDFNGEEQVETAYFHFTEAELSEMELRENGGLQGMIQVLIETRDNSKIVDIFKKFILESYGQRSADGRSFFKYDAEGHRLADAFAQTAAYSAFFMELATSSQKQLEFVNGILPKKMQGALNDPEIMKQVRAEHPELAAKLIEYKDK